MILFHAKRDGTVTTTPNFVPQGSSMQDLVVVSEFDYAYCAIKLLPASGEYIEDTPCTPILQRDFSTIFTASLNPKATVVAGSVDYQLIFTAADGTTQTTLAGSFTVPRGVPVATPGSVEELAVKTINDLYAIMANTYGLFVGHERDIYQSLADIAALKKTVSSAGYVTIPVTQWNDGTPTIAEFTLDGFGAGMTAMLIPADSNTQTAAREARLSAYPVAFPIDSDTQTVEIIRADADKAPDIPLRFAYLILKTADTSVAPTVAILGVDAYGEGGGGAASGVDEIAVKAIITEMLGNVENVRQYSAKNPPPYPVTKVNGQTGEVNLPIPSEAADVGADPAGTAESKTAALRQEVNGKLEDYDKSTAVNKKIGDHNVSTASHADLRLELQRLADRLNAALNSDDTSLDDLKEIVAYIKANKTLLDGFTSSKVNVTDIVDNLVTNKSNFPLSAAQGVVLKLLIYSLEDVVEGKVTADQAAAQIKAALADYLTKEKIAELYQPKGNYLTSSDIPTIPDKLPNPKPLTINGKTYDGSQAVSVNVDGSGEEIPTIVLPSKIYAVVGHEYVLYYRNILQAMRPDDFVVSAIISNSAITDLKPLYRDKIMFTPTEALVGQHTITIIVKSRRTWNDVAQKSVTLVISAERAFEGKRVMFIGDSLTFAAKYAEAVGNMSDGGILSVGTVTAKSVPTEGRNGAASYDYLVKDTIQGAHNPFYNPNRAHTLELDDKYVVNGQDGVSSKIPMDNSGDRTIITHHFDFEYYMSNHSSTVGDLDAVFINLGNNGGIRSSYKTVHMGFLAMVDRIRAYDPDLPIFLHLFIPKSEAGSIERNFSGQFDGLLNDRTWYYKIVQFYIDKWDNDPRVNLVPTYTMVDTYHDFKLQTVPVSARNPIEVTIGDNDGVHPATPGYDHMADSYYNIMLAYWSGEPIDTYYTVINRLDNVTNSNTTTSVKAGNSYTATLTAASGYTLDSVTVTMGGEPVSVSGGKISISAVTGDIFITATAIKDEEPEEPTVENLVDPSTANDENPNTELDADEWVNSHTITGSNTTLAITQAAGRFVSDKFPISDNAKVRIQGMDMSSSKRASNKLLIIMSDGRIFRDMAMPIGEPGTASVDQNLVESEGTMLVTIGAFGQAASWPGKAYARICGYPKDGDNSKVVVTVE